MVYVMLPCFPTDFLIHHHPMRPARLFLDTEFSNFGAPDKCGVKLLSLALVDETGDLFYAEADGWDATDCNDFVLETVVPLLSAPKESIKQVADRLHDYLAKFDHAVVHCDYQGDWDWLTWVLAHATSGRSTWPSALHHEPHYIDTSNWAYIAQSAVDVALLDWFQYHAQHHAANDANGLRYAWVKAREALGWVEDPGTIRRSST